MKKTLTFLLIVINSLLLHAEPVKLITSPGQLWSDCGLDGNNNLSVLLDDNIDTYWQSDNKDAITHEHFIDVIFPDGLTLAENDSIVVMLRRTNARLAQPTAFEIRGSENPESVTSEPTTWTEGFRYAFFTYRGVKTMEYSARIPLITGKTYYRLRFIIKANNSKSFSQAGFRHIDISEFQIYKLTGTDQYPGNLADRFHLKTDMHYDYADYKLLRTGGILDPEVRRGVSNLDNWIGTNPGLDRNTGKWTQNLDFFEKYKDRLSPPDYTQVSNANDSRVMPGVEYQPTHVTEHELYAIPGDAVALYPFYGLNTTTAYEEKFSHWYNYQTGGNVTDSKGNRVLDFLVDPSGITKSNEYGWYGGVALRYGISERKTYHINSVSDYKAFVTACNNGEITAIGILDTDLDFTGVTDIDPIGTNEAPFVGCFNGRGHTIRNLNITKTNGRGVGLFGWISAGTVIENLVIDRSCTISGAAFVGIIGGYKAGSTTGLKTVEIANIVNHGTILSTGGNNGGILGFAQSGDGCSPVSLNIRSCAFTGTIKGTAECGFICGMLEVPVQLYVENCFSTGQMTTGGNYYDCLFVIPQAFAGCHQKDCYSATPDRFSTAMTAAEATSESFIAKIGGNWQYNPDGFPTTREVELFDPEKNKPLPYKGERVYGTVATFFYPRDVTQHQLQELDKEYYIAADFSQDMDFDQCFNHTDKTIREPLVNFRHIFHIKDGKKFADDNCSTKEKNEAYIRKNRRRITAEAGKLFQIRFNSPIPAEPTTRSRLYYKVTSDGTDYRRVCSMRIRVKDSHGNILKDVTDANNLTGTTSFFASELFHGYGTRTIDGITYYTCGGGGSYYRMLSCTADRAIEGTYIVQIIGLDYNGDVIIIPDGSGAELLIQEFEITFLPKTAAVLIPETELKKDEYRHASNEWLTTNYGAPRDKIDYDQYMLYNELSQNERDKYLDMNNSRGIGRSKWPVEWSASNYSFAYNNQHDYNMYQVVSHSNYVMYHGQPDANMPADKNYNAGIKGLFDRRFYETEGAQKGFYYWVNASADPGVMGYLHLADFCAGSTVHVSGWISEFSGGESANLTLNFIAIMKDSGERIPIHSHTTGYVPQDNTMGTWLYFYASFVPIFTDKDIDIKDIDHYEIELDNNCKNSAGADYAIDDIRVYLVKPVVYADQSEPICTQSNVAEIKISSPFNVLMQSLGKASASDASHGEQLDLYYSFVDYKKYRKLIDAGNTSDQAFDQAVLRYNYRDGDTETYFGKISFNTHFPSNEEYHEGGETLAGYAFRQTINGTDLIAFDTRPKDNAMSSGKEYLVVLYLPHEGETFADGEGPSAAQYQIGSFGSDNDCSKSCTFRVMAAHSIKIDGEVKNPNEIIESCRNQSPVVQVDLYGLFDGKLDLVEENARFDWFVGSTEEFSQIEDGGVYLWDAVSRFRQYYPAATDIEYCEPVGDFTAADRDIIDKYSRIDPTGATKPRMILSQTSYVFPPLMLNDGETEREEYVLAVPIPVIKEGEAVNYLICTQPTEVRVTVRQRAPRIRHGLGQIAYPPAIDDVPLRVSLSELRKTSTATTDTAEINAHTYQLEIPIYDVKAVTEGVTAMRLPGGGSPIYIAQTDDPEYKNLSFEEPLGELRLLDAVTGESTNRFCALFYSNRITFKEGYTYRFRFTFEEKNGNTAAAGDEVCTGQDVFTIKVVPEFQKWTGATNLNWNNDTNWRRVASDEIHSTPSALTTDGGNDNAASFAPLDFTKVIIPEGATFPHLFNETTVPVMDFDWTEHPSENNIAGDATPLVQYDMAQLLKPGIEGLFCRPWYAHTCGQIHFEPRSQIAGQQFLHYNCAWVDMEMKPSIWLTASSPLRDVVAGDMYLPSDGARQASTYFEQINFDVALNDRFMPAVFQRSWNQASATVYKYPDHDGDTENVAVETTWSRVYNDVRVPYSAGHGFSIRTDLSKYGENRPDEVLFRLPKADTFYDYYTDGGDTGDKTAIGRTNPGRLCFDENTNGPLTATITAGTDDNKFFLAGNPFMAHLDMARFFAANPGIEPKYWILTGALQGAAVMSPDGTIIGSTGDSPDYLPPLYGFFVEAKTPGRQLTLNFTDEMMAVPGFAPDRRSSRSQAGIRITAVESGSTALILTDLASDASYSSGEDALFINDPTLGTAAGIFTRSRRYAMTVNVCPEIEGTEVGITADDDATTTLRFDGVDGADGLMLYDAAQGVYHPLADGREIAVKGAANRRLYIVGSRMDAPGHSIAMTLSGHTLSITSVAGGLTARIYNTSGVMIDADTDGGTSADFTLTQGIYIVEASDAENDLVRKFYVR